MIGKKVRLIYMSDQYAPPPGTEGVIKHIDDMGQIHVKWDNNSSLALLPGIDKYHIID
jgi:hypothetical protein